MESGGWSQNTIVQGTAAHNDWMLPLQRPLFRPPARGWGWLVAVLLHAGLLWLGWTWSAAPAPGPATPAVVWWQLPLNATTQAHTALAAPERPRAALPPPVSAAPMPTATPRRADGATEGTQALQAAALPDVGTGAGHLPAAAASAASAPLKLDLPRRPPRGAREASLGEALNDPRSNSPVKTVESRIAAVTGDGRVTVEDLGDGRKRYRQGARCIETRPFRGNQIAPFNAGLRTAPDMVGDC
jgi:hypothetical protein